MFQELEIDSRFSFQITTVAANLGLISDGPSFAYPGARLRIWLILLPDVWSTVQ